MLSKIPQHRRKTTVYLSPVVLDRLADMRAETGVPVAESVRRAVDEYLVAKSPVATHAARTAK